MSAVDGLAPASRRMSIMSSSPHTENRIIYLPDHNLSWDTVPHHVMDPSYQHTWLVSNCKKYFKSLYPPDGVGAGQFFIATSYSASFAIWQSIIAHSVKVTLNWLKFIAVVISKAWCKVGKGINLYEMLFWTWIFPAIMHPQVIQEFCLMTISPQGGMSLVQPHFRARAVKYICVWSLTIDCWLETIHKYSE